MILRNFLRVNLRNSLTLVWVAWIGLLSAACSTSAPTRIAQVISPAPIVSPTQVPRDSMIVSPPASEIPPPTWTPIPSLTPRPTDTPLPPPSPTRTFTVAELCQDFQVLFPPENAKLDYAAVISIGWQGIPSGQGMVVTITQQGGKAGLRLDVGLDGGGIVPIPLKRLPGPGPYIWKAWVQHTAYGPICEKTGGFVRKGLVIF